MILDALDELMVGRTSFMIAHRLSTVRDADLILVIDHGGSSSRARTTSCCEQGGLYRQLHDAQTRKRQADRPTEQRAAAIAPGTSTARVGSRRRIPSGVERRTRRRPKDRRARDDDQDARWRASSGRPSTTCSASERLGLRRLLRRGARAHAVDADGERAATTARPLAAAFIDRVMRRFDLGDRWAYHGAARRRPLLRHERAAARSRSTASPS